MENQPMGLDDEEEDEVIMRTPVYLTQELKDELFVLQYPLRPIGRPYQNDIGQLTSVKMRPEHKTVAFEYRLDVESGNFDPNAEFPVSSMTLSAKYLKPKTNYVVGKFSKSGLHLTPIHALCRVRPSFDYIDSRDNAEKEEQTKQDDAEDEKKSKKKKEVRPVMMTYKKTESDRSAAWRKASHAYIKGEEEAEAWVDLTVFDANSEETQQEMGKLLLSPSQNGVPLITFNIGAQKFLEYMNPPWIEEEPNVPFFAHPVSNVYDRTFELIKSSKVLPMFQICRMAQVRTQTQLTEVFRCLLKNALLVQGVWCCKSLLLSTGRAAMGRTYLLCLFSQYDVLRRSDVDAVLQLDMETTREVFDQVAVCVPADHPAVLAKLKQEKKPSRKEEVGEGVATWWVFRYPRDDRFLSAFPVIAAEQQLNNLTTLERLGTALQKDALPSLPPSTSSSSHKQAPVRNSAAGANVSRSIPATSSSSSPASSTDFDAPLRVFFERQFQNNSGCSLAVLHTNFKTDQVVPKSALSKFQLDEAGKKQFAAVLDACSICVRGLYFRKSLNNPEVDKYRDLIISMFMEASSLKKNDINARAEEVLNEAISDTLYTRIMREFAVFSKGLWVLKEEGFTGVDDAAMTAKAEQ